MNIRDLKYLIAVADLEHFGQAADRCCVSQPTLSMQLKKLEDEFEVQLFERTNKSVMITKAGKAFVDHARVILREIDTLKKIAEYSKDPMAGEFHLGIIPTIAPYLLPRVLSILKKSFPKIKWVIVENKTEVITKQLKEGLLDAVISALPINEPGLKTHTLFDESFFVALPKQHPLKSKAKLTHEDIKHETLLLLQDGHCLREQVLEVCRLNALNSISGFEATSLETLIHLVGSGAGVTLLPEMATQKIHSNVVLKPFSKPSPKRTIGLVWRENSARSACYEKMKTALKENL